MKMKKLLTLGFFSFSASVAHGMHESVFIGQEEFNLLNNNQKRIQSSSLQDAFLQGMCEKGLAEIGVGTINYFLSLDEVQEFKNLFVTFKNNEELDEQLVETLLQLGKSIRAHRESYLENASSSLGVKILLANLSQSNYLKRFVQKCKENLIAEDDILILKNIFLSFLNEQETAENIGIISSLLDMASNNDINIFLQKDYARPLIVSENAFDHLYTVARSVMHNPASINQIVSDKIITIIENGSVNIASLFLKNNANLLHICATIGLTELSEYLVKNELVDISAQTDEGFSASVLAYKNRHLELARKLASYEGNMSLLTTMMNENRKNLLQEIRNTQKPQSWGNYFFGW